MELGFPRWVGVVCEDFEKQRSFYRDVLGLRERDEGDGWVQYDMGPTVTFELLRRSPDPEYDRRRSGDAEMRNPPNGVVRRQACVRVRRDRRRLGTCR